MDFWWETQRSEQAQDLREIYHSAMYGADRQQMLDAGIEPDDMRYLFDVGFVADEVTPEERQQARDEFFEWVSRIGYDISDFDWDAWREYYEEKAG